MTEKTAYIINRFLERKANLSEKAELRSWLKESDENKKTFLSYYSAWDLSMQIEFDPQVALKKMHKLIKERHLDNKITKTTHVRKHYYLYAASVAASLVLAIGIYFFSAENRSNINIREIAAQRLSFIKSTNNIQLILSENHTIPLKNKTADITYSIGNVNVDHQRNLKLKGTAFNQLVVPKGHKGMLSLEDGTKIWLKGGSWLLYPTNFDKNGTREVYVDGEIYLEVSHNLQKPFIVRTKAMNIRVTGTKFDVVAYSKERTSKVALACGSVQVYQTGRQEMTARKLFPGEIYDLSADHKESVRTGDINQYTSWVNDVYECNDETMQYVASELEKFYGKHIVCASDIAQMPCSGKLDLQKDLSTLLNDITEVLSIHYHIKDGIYYISK